MGIYHPKTGAGVVHYSATSDLPAKKVWSWGCDADGLEWRKALSDNNSAENVYHVNQMATDKEIILKVL
jgi:hypothetical protein